MSDVDLTLVINNSVESDTIKEVCKKLRAKYKRPMDIYCVKKTESENQLKYNKSLNLINLIPVNSVDDLTPLMP
jgi:hypothetical protein